MKAVPPAARVPGVPPAAPRAPSAFACLAATLAIQVLASAAVIAPTAVAPVIGAQMGLPAAAVGLYVALVYLGAMLASVLGSHFIARHGAIRTSQASLALCAAGLGLIATATLWAALPGAFILGLGYGPITPASSQILARTTPAHRMGLVFSLKQTGVPLGGVIAGLVVPPLSLAAGWPLALGLLAAASLLCAALAQPLRAALDADAGGSQAGAGTGFGALARPVALVWADATLRRLALCSLVFSCVQVCVTAYLVSFLTAQLHWALVAAGVALSVTQTAGVAGRVLWGAVADRGPGARRMLLALCVLMIAAGAAMPLLRPDSPAALVLALLAIYGGTAIGWNGVYLAEVARLAPPGQAGVATGGVLAFTYLGVVAGPPLFGALASSGAGFGWAYAATGLPLLGCLALLAGAGRVRKA
ncbi:MFS transporter [Azohydromonas aeria]|uniref:MFS transporter n=1 Tax=Azohydromonas aeria TaxID=2590212 RepID=UPI001E53816F|nr:MFS transporter [Azohydromonas aeria]